MDRPDQYLLRMEGITKTFPGVTALDNVTLRVQPGTVHTIMGENGAGKSTLMKVLSGSYPADKGTVFFDGEQVEFNSSNDALRHGISMIHQELSIIPDMTVADNIYLGHAPSSFGMVNDKKLMEMTTALFDKLGIDPIPPKTRMRELSIARMQMVEIAKAASFESKIIIMDEPTSAISEKEVEVLFNIIRELKAKGTAIIYISHKMDEIFQISDYITVLRDGKYVDTKPASELDNDKLVKMMVGRDLTEMFKRTPAPLGDTVLEVRNLTRFGKFYNVNLSLRKGEILGITGLIGAGRTEVAEAIFGIWPADSGEILVHGRHVNVRRPIDAINNGIAFLTEDRKRQGLFLGLSVKRNVSICKIRELSRMNIVDVRNERVVCRQYVESLRIKTPSIATKVRSLSGGNQQKALIARWLLMEPDILILDEPTRGIDVGAKQEIYALIDKLTRDGKAVILISSEMPEVISMCDRIIVMNQGEAKKELTHGFTQEDIMHHAANFESIRRTVK
ncbi:MAG: sugar ABC transporter ATP-binding protein [Planctomycetaceae bacterium]|nr:sugar ABC transporter ATP-binding protein [Planctomycetaceae bacterium]